jgi:hypothetical protein
MITFAIFTEKSTFSPEKRPLKAKIGQKKSHQAIEFAPQIAKKTAKTAPKPAELPLFSPIFTDFRPPYRISAPLFSPKIGKKTRKTAEIIGSGSLIFQFFRSFFGYFTRENPYFFCLSFARFFFAGFFLFVALKRKKNTKKKGARCLF